MYQAFKLLEKELPIINPTQKVDIKLLDLLKGELLSASTTHPGFHFDSKILSEVWTEEYEDKKQVMRKDKVKRQCGSRLRQPNRRILCWCCCLQTVHLIRNWRFERLQSYRLKKRKVRDALFMCLSTWVLARLLCGLNSRDGAAGGIWFWAFDIRLWLQDIGLHIDPCVAVATDKVFSTVVAPCLKGMFWCPGARSGCARRNFCLHTKRLNDVISFGEREGRRGKTQEEEDRWGRRRGREWGWGRMEKRGNRGRKEQESEMEMESTKHEEKLGKEETNKRKLLVPPP